MKKAIILVLSILLLIIAAMPILATEEVQETTVTVQPSATVVQRGETLKLTVKMSGNVKFTSVAIKLNFDANVFEFVSGTDETNGTGMLVPYDGTTMGLAFMGGAATYNGTLQVLTFKAKDTAPMAATAFTAEPKGTAAGGADLTVRFVGASVSINCDHTYPKDSKGAYIYTQVGADKHQQTCTKCNTPKVEAHTWNDGEPISRATCTEDGEEKFTCEICHVTKTEKVNKTGHKWDNDCDTTCNNDPSHTRKTSHKYSDKWTPDSTSHWHECTSCGERKDNADHTPGPEATEESAQICTVCKYEIKPKVVHVHQFSTEWVNDSENHWHRCLTNEPLCIVKDSVAPHDYDNACDIDCNTCGYVRVAPHNYTGEWQASIKGHWGVCTICNTQSNVLPHTPGPEATEDTPQTCTECNFIIKMELSHVHDFGEIWYGDDTNHWQSCSDIRCPEVQSMEPHTWDAGEEQAEGGFLYTCTICAKQVTLAEPLPTEPVTTPSSGTPSKPAAPQKPEEKEPKDAISWEWAGIAAIILLIIGVGLLVFEFIRSRKTNMHGKFSK